MREKEEMLLKGVPAISELEEWVTNDWNLERQPESPPGTTSIVDDFGHEGSSQLDSRDAVFKLLLASAVYGVECVAGHARDFARYNAIEVHRFFLLQGEPPRNAIQLDAYCKLLPYAAATEKLASISSEHTSEEDLHWPKGDFENVCVLETRGFESRRPNQGLFDHHVSPLLQCGPEILTLILGLIWGRGFRIFGNWHGVSEQVQATLPFYHMMTGPGYGGGQAALFRKGFRWASPERPLNTKELAELVERWNVLDRSSKRRLRIAMRRLRDAAGRMELDDRAIDICIALEAMFVEQGEWRKQKKLVSRRASWHFADSTKEREETRATLKCFYDHRSSIVHANVSTSTQGSEDLQQQQALTLLDVENVTRASVKTMIEVGRPLVWTESKQAKMIRQKPVRPAKQIPSTKSDSLSWTVAEQKAIDKALWSVWRPEVEGAPPPSVDANPEVRHGVIAEKIKICRQEGIPFVVSLPIRLYWSHPMWPKDLDEVPDERTKYYCHRDVQKHLEEWQEAAANKRMWMFVLPLENPELYQAEKFEMWRKILEQGGVM